MRARVADVATRLVHIVIQAPNPTSEKDVGFLLCNQRFVWDSAPNWFCEKVTKAGHIVGSRRSFEAMPTCLQCVALDTGEDE